MRYFCVVCGKQVAVNVILPQEDYCLHRECLKQALFWLENAVVGEEVTEETKSFQERRKH